MYHNEFSQIGFLLHVTCSSAWPLHQVISLADLLLLETPFGEFDLVRKQITSTEGMTESELASKSLEPMSSLPIPSSTSLGCDLDDEVVIRISREAT